MNLAAKRDPLGRRGQRYLGYRGGVGGVGIGVVVVMVVVVVVMVVVVVVMVVVVVVMAERLGNLDGRRRRLATRWTLLRSRRAVEDRGVS